MRWLVTLFSAVLLLSLSTLLARAADVYLVDRANPNASLTGPGTALKPYSTITAALNAHPDSGVWILVKPGTYRERIVVPASGSPLKPIVIRAEGAVIVDGADDFASGALWSHLSGDVWVAAGVTWNPVQVFADGGRLQLSTQNSAHQVEPGRFAWFAGQGLAVNIDGGSPATHAIAVGHRTHGFLVSNKSSVVIEGFEVQRAEQKGIELVGVSNVIVKHNVVHASAAGGIEVANASKVQVYANTVSDNNNHGIIFRLGVTNSIIDANESFGNIRLGLDGATGIYLSESSNNRIEGNRLHDNQDSGCEIQTNSNDNVVVQNVSWSNGDHGFAHLYATGTLLLNNVAWGNHTEGFSVEGGATGTRIYNSISVNRALAPESYCMFVDSSSTAGFDADFDILWNIADQPPIRFGQVVYSNVAAFQAGTGIGLSSFGADPRFVNAPGGDFHLRFDSPAIDAATSAVAGWEETDADGRMRADEPDVPNTGAGPFGFSDRGAYEYRSATLSVREAEWTGGLALSSPFPNPSRRTAAFVVEQSTAGDVRWSVFDIMGREQWSGGGTLPAGRSELRWPLTDRSGARVPSGIYLVRVQRGREVATSRAVVMP
jgi:parallel beta-helix repeat protein